MRYSAGVDNLNWVATNRYGYWSADCIFMTLPEAQQALSGKLVFGNATQIEALKVLEIEARVQSILNACAHEITCPRCKGEGYLDCVCSECGDRHERECPQCKGEHVLPRPCEDCVKLSQLERDRRICY